LQAGAEVRAVVELALPPGAWALCSLARMLATSPVLTLRGARYVAALRRAGVALRHGSALAGVRPGDGGLVAEVTEWPIAGAETGERFEVDAVCLGYGFMPSNEIARALGCLHRFDRARGQLVVQRDADCRTSVPEIYVVGDCAGLGGAPAAAAEGVIAGLAAVRALGLTADRTAQASERRARAALARHRRFQQGLWRLFAAPRIGLDLADAATPVCRCEELTRAEIEAALAPAAAAIGTLKRRTRSGMGRCQGRYCGPLLAALAAESRGEAPAEEGHWAPRPPVKPIAIGDLTG
jgi:NAD(P)H-nitrite reductase large subunit